jgi:hypothetical protein
MPFKNCLGGAEVQSRAIIYSGGVFCYQFSKAVDYSKIITRFTTLAAGTVLPVNGIRFKIQRHETTRASEHVTCDSFSIFQLVS